MFVHSCCGTQSVYNPSRMPHDLYLVRSTMITSCRFCGNYTGCPCGSQSNSRSLSWSSSVCAACADSARLTRRCVLFNGHTTPSAIDVWQWLWNQLPSKLWQCESLGSSRHTCSGTTALCDILVKSPVQKSAYLLTYLLTIQRRTVLIIITV